MLKPTSIAVPLLEHATSWMLRKCWLLDLVVWQLARPENSIILVCPFPIYLLNSWGVFGCENLIV